MLPSPTEVAHRDTFQRVYQRVLEGGAIRPPPRPFENLGYFAGFEEKNADADRDLRIRSFPAEVEALERILNY